MSMLKALAIGGLMPLVSLPLALGGMAVGAAYGAGRILDLGLQGGKGLMKTSNVHDIFGVKVPGMPQVKRATGYAIAGAAFAAGTAHEYHGWKMSTENSKGIPEMERDSMMGASGSITLNSQHHGGSVLDHNADDALRYAGRMVSRLG